jgi:secreted PhoX family phosphatase
MTAFKPAPTRRHFLQATGSAFAALAASGCITGAGQALGGAIAEPSPYSPLRADPAGLLDLPDGFSYRIISRLGDPMDDGGTVPDNADGMGCFAMPDGDIALVRNHELKVHHASGGTLVRGYDRKPGGAVLPGGTTTILLDPETLVIKRQHRSLAGTIRNCAGGVTPWGSWLTCEEDVTLPGGDAERDHGWIFEVPANAAGLVDPVPLKAMGRFNHEAASVDPATGIVYLTEDRDEGLLYRFIPNMAGKLAEGGRLQALAVPGNRLPDSRNWSGSHMPVGERFETSWIDLDDVESPNDDLRLRGAARGATMFARGEGIHMGDGELYFCCTSGGAKVLGQVFRLRLPANGPAGLQLFFESTSPDQFNYGDNLTVAPSGHLIVCEDQYTEVVDNYLRGITPSGTAYPFARLRRQTELAGACFSPDGGTLFVNFYSPAMTVAIRGPWAA